MKRLSQILWQPLFFLLFLKLGHNFGIFLPPAGRMDSLSIEFIDDNVPNTALKSIKILASDRVMVIPV